MANSRPFWSGGYHLPPQLRHFEYGSSLDDDEDDEWEDEPEYSDEDYGGFHSGGGGGGYRSRNDNEPGADPILAAQRRAHDTGGEGQRSAAQKREEELEAAWHGLRGNHGGFPRDAVILGPQETPLPPETAGSSTGELLGSGENGVEKKMVAVPLTEDMLEELCCPLCLDVCQDAMQGRSCPHIFCGKCFDSLPHGAPCPVCRKPNIKHNSKNAISVRAKVSSLRVRCPLRDPFYPDCEWTGVLRDYMSHLMHNHEEADEGEWCVNCQKRHYTHKPRDPRETTTANVISVSANLSGENQAPRHVFGGPPAATIPTPANVPSAPRNFWANNTATSGSTTRGGFQGQAWGAPSSHPNPTTATASATAPPSVRPFFGTEPASAAGGISAGGNFFGGSRASVSAASGRPSSNMSWPRAWSNDRAPPSEGTSTSVNGGFGQFVFGPRPATTSGGSSTNVASGGPFGFATSRALGSRAPPSAMIPQATTGAEPSRPPQQEEGTTTTGGGAKFGSGGFFGRPLQPPSATIPPQATGTRTAPPTAVAPPKFKPFVPRPATDQQVKDMWEEMEGHPATTTCGSSTNVASGGLFDFATSRALGSRAPPSATIPQATTGAESSGPLQQEEEGTTAPGGGAKSGSGGFFGRPLQPPSSSSAPPTTAVAPPTTNWPAPAAKVPVTVPMETPMAVPTGLPKPATTPFGKTAPTAQPPRPMSPTAAAAIDTGFGGSPTTSEPTAVTNAAVTNGRKFVFGSSFSSPPSASNAAAVPTSTGGFPSAPSPASGSDRAALYQNLGTSQQRRSTDAPTPDAQTTGWSFGPARNQASSGSFGRSTSGGETKQTPTQSTGAATGAATAMLTGARGNLPAPFYALGSGHEGQPPPLPPGWEAAFLPLSEGGGMYYLNHMTKTTAWSIPKEVAIEWEKKKKREERVARGQETTDDDFRALQEQPPTSNFFLSSRPAVPATATSAQSNPNFGARRKKRF